jgi:osmoprotectant transport system substrate-binding protein
VPAAQAWSAPAVVFLALAACTPTAITHHHRLKEFSSRLCSASWWHGIENAGLEVSGASISAEPTSAIRRCWPTAWISTSSTAAALTAILKDPPQSDPAAVYARVRDEYARRFDLEVAPPLGFNNTFAIVIRGEDARRLNLRTLSDAARYAPQWRAGFGYEFMERPDGYAGLAQTYGLRFAAPPRIMDLGLLYRALLEKQVDLVAGNSTDGLIAAHDLVVLEDDRHYIPPYEAVPNVRRETLARHPQVRAALAELAGLITDAEMRRLNYAVDGEHRDAKDVVREFLQEKGLTPKVAKERTR